MRRTALIQARQALGLSQEAMAAAISRARSTYACYEAGLRNPPMQVWLKLSRITGRPVEELVGVSDVSEEHIRTSDAHFEHTGPGGGSVDSNLSGSETEVKPA